MPHLIFCEGMRICEAKIEAFTVKDNELEVTCSLELKFSYFLQHQVWSYKRYLLAEGKAWRVYLDCRGAVRQGINLCRYKLGHFEEIAQYLAVNKGLNIADTVLDVLDKYGYNSPTAKMVIIQSTSSSILKAMQRVHYEFVYEVDPIVWINTFVNASNVDGVVTDFPQTAAPYMRNLCLLPPTLTVEEVSQPPLPPGIETPQLHRPQPQLQSQMANKKLLHLHCYRSWVCLWQRLFYFDNFAEPSDEVPDEVG